MSIPIDRNTFDGHWLEASDGITAYTKFKHRPVAERTGTRATITDHLAAAVVDHHVPRPAVENALRRLKFTKAAESLLSRFPTDHNTRMGNFGEVLASEHLRQRYGYQMPVFKLRFMDTPAMPMRGEDIVAFRISLKSTITTLCIGESKVLQDFDARQVEDAHGRLTQAYRPHPVSLVTISNILYERNDPLAEQVDRIIQTLGTKPVPRDNWIFICTGNMPADPFRSVQEHRRPIENLTCVNLRLDGLVAFVNGIFDRPVRRETAPPKS